MLLISNDEEQREEMRFGVTVTIHFTLDSFLSQISKIFVSLTGSPKERQTCFILPTMLRVVSVYSRSNFGSVCTVIEPGVKYFLIYCNHPKYSVATYLGVYRRQSFEISDPKT